MPPVIQELLEVGLGGRSRRSDPTRTQIVSHRLSERIRQSPEAYAEAIQLRRPRVRDTEEQFESRLLPLFVNGPGRLLS